MTTARADSLDPDETTATLERELAALRQRLGQLRRRRDRFRRELERADAAHREVLRAVRALEAALGRTAGGPVSALAGAPRLKPIGGRDLREALIRSVLRRAAHGQPLHWSAWLAWLRQDGYDASGQSADATFQTQLSRSPLVRRTDQDGVFVLDVSLLGELRERLVSLQTELGTLPGPEQMMLVGDGQQARQGLRTEVGRTERQLAEAWRILADELAVPPDNADWDLQRLQGAWLARRASA